uniref:Uncharacterized protein n=1 Tax=Plectus sambesii TaxID=2011161 RepID=A0A914UHY6_9BILA
MLILIASCWCLPLAHALQDNSTPASFDSADAKPILQANSYQWKLMNKLLNTYDRALRPVQFINTTTNVTLNPALHSIISTNEAMESIGLVFWLRMIINFPFDVQNCTLHILSWTLSADEMDIFPSYPADLGPYREHAEWDLISFSARRTLTTYGNLSSPFVDVYYDIVIQRKPTYYLTTFVLPSFIITTLAIVGIFSPFTDSGGREEKVTMGLTTLLTMSIILLLVTEQMPKSSEGVPLLGLYILFQIALSASASCISIFVMYQHLKWTKGKPVPRWFLKITLSMEKETVEQIVSIL